MSDPRSFEPDPNDPSMPRNRYVGRQSDVGSGSGWIIAGVIVVVLLGVAAYSVHDTQVSSSSTPGTTTGQSSRPPVPSTPPAAPVAPASRPQQQP